MSKLRQHLVDIYEEPSMAVSRMLKKETPIQIDDQDDNDSLNEFCTIFVSVKKYNLLEIELAGAIPITDEMADLAEIYNGHTDRKNGKLVLRLRPIQIGALLDLAAKIRATAFKGKNINNPNWHRISARTISSLHRFVRTIREYQENKGRLI